MILIIQWYTTPILLWLWSHLKKYSNIRVVDMEWLMALNRHVDDIRPSTIKPFPKMIYWFYFQKVRHTCYTLSVKWLWTFVYFRYKLPTACPGEILIIPRCVMIVTKPAEHREFLALSVVLKVVAHTVGAVLQ